jgi:hypothetical protein
VKYLTIEQLIILIYYSWIIVGCVIIIYFLSLRRSSRNSGLWSVCRCVPNWSKNIFYRIYCFSIFEQYDKPPTWRIPPLWLWRKCEVVVRTNRICDDFCTLRIFQIYQLLELCLGRWLDWRQEDKKHFRNYYYRLLLGEL